MHGHTFEAACGPAPRGSVESHWLRMVRLAGGGMPPLVRPRLHFRADGRDVPQRIGGIDRGRMPPSPHLRLQSAGATDVNDRRGSVSRVGRRHAQNSLTDVGQSNTASRRVAAGAAGRLEVCEAAELAEGFRWDLQGLAPARVSLLSGSLGEKSLKLEMAPCDEFHGQSLSIRGSLVRWGLRPRSRAIIPGWNFRECVPAPSAGTRFRTRLSRGVCGAVSTCASHGLGPEGASPS